MGEACPLVLTGKILWHENPRTWRYTSILEEGLCACFWYHLQVSVLYIMAHQLHPTEYKLLMTLSERPLVIAKAPSHASTDPKTNGSRDRPP